MSWSSVHGDLTGAYRTGLMGALTKLQLTSKDILIGGTWYSLFIIWRIFEAALTPIAKKDSAAPNVFDTILGRHKEHTKSEALKKEEPKAPLAKNEEDEKEWIEPLDSAP